MKKILFILVAFSVLSLSFASFAVARPGGGGGHGGGHASGHSSGGTAKAASHTHNTSKGGSNKSATKSTGNKSDPKGSNGKNYHNNHAHKFAHGHYYRGRNHNHWGHYRYDDRYGCQLFWDDGLNGWYYFCCQDDRFYPVDYCPYGTYTCCPSDVTPAEDQSTEPPPMPNPVPDPIPTPMPGLRR